MCEEYTIGIEHPNQDSWIAGLASSMTDEQKAALAARYVDVPFELVAMPSLYRAVEIATLINHTHRATHESGNRGQLGIGSIDDQDVSGALRLEYDQLTGRAQKASDFVLWFSRVAHAAFMNQDAQPLRQGFTHVSLELGGTRQFGNWEATHKLDEMARGIPKRILHLVPDASLTIYDEPRETSIRDARIKYVDEWHPSYRLLPNYQIPSAVHQQQRTFSNHGYDDFVVIRRRRPVADIYIPGESDVVIFKESIGMLVMPLIAPDVRAEIIEDSKRVFEATRNKRDAKEMPPAPLDDTPGATYAGEIFEADISSGPGVSKNTVALSAHYVQGVGEKFTRFRGDKRKSA